MGPAFINALNQLDWTEDQISGFESTAQDAAQLWYCGISDRIDNVRKIAFVFCNCQKH